MTDYEAGYKDGFISGYKEAFIVMKDKITDEIINFIDGIKKEFENV